MRRLVFGLLSIALLLSVAVPSTHAQAPTFSLSPEEAVIALLPFKLSPQDAPPGYSVGAIPAIATSVSLSAQATSLSNAFQVYQNEGFVVSVGQRLLPAGQSTSTQAAGGTFIVDLFTDPTKAAANVLRSPVAVDTQFASVTLNSPIGDASAAWHASHTPSGEQGQGFYYVKWQRGPLNFAVFTPPLPLGQEQQASAESLAAALDAIEQGRPSLSLDPATVMPPATEAQRFQAASELHGVFLPASAAPDGYKLSASYFYRHPAEAVATAPNPDTALHTIDEQWKVIIRDQQIFTNQGNSQLDFQSLATLCADPHSAESFAENVVSGPTAWTDTRIDAPIQLGDATYAHLNVGADSQGAPQEGNSLYWTHGALVLSVGMFGPSGTTSMNQVVALAQQVEARFQANVLPTRGLPDLTATSVPSGSPPRQFHNHGVWQRLAGEQAGDTTSDR